MLAKRIIPCLDVHAGRVVKGVNFVNLRDAGDPVEIARRYEDEGADELVFLDITASHEQRDILLDVVRRTSEVVFMPLTVGGGIRTLEDIRTLLKAGCDKVSINSAAVNNPDFVRQAALRFGSQCIVVNIDPKRVPVCERKGTGSRPTCSQPPNPPSASVPVPFLSQTFKDQGSEGRDQGSEGRDQRSAAGGQPAAGPSTLHAQLRGIDRGGVYWDVHINGGRLPTGLDAVEWAREVERLGAGEIVLTCMDADGTQDGYDIEITRAVAEAVSIPVVASGGAGRPEHLYEALTAGQASAALAASIFHYGTFRIEETKRYLASRGVPVRFNVAA